MRSCERWTAGATWVGRMVLFFEDGDGEAHVHECAGTADYLEDAAADGGDDLLD